MLLTRKMYQPTMNELVDQFFNSDYINSIENSFNVSRPKANIQNLGDVYQIEMLVPGFDKKDFEISVEDEMLKVSAKMEMKKEEKGKNSDQTNSFLHQEFEMQSVERNFKLGHKIDATKIKASYEQGILKIVVPKKEDAIVKRLIEIK